MVLRSSNSAASSDLQANNENLDQAIKLYEPFIRLYANIVGNGRWFDQVVVNLLPPGLPADSG